MFLDHRHLEKIEQKANELLDSLGINSPPVPIGDILDRLGIATVRYDLGAELSGILIVQGDKGTIGYNPSDSRTRQRFTLAHELGHFLLHKHLGSEVFIDKDFIVKYRSQKTYSSLELKQEQQANIFAAALLMPKKMLQDEFEREIYKDLSESEFIAAIAKVFNVSIQAMTYRIANSNLI
jgi:Zn-dependent peptidase ImmA (M78 family)